MDIALTPNEFTALVDQLRAEIFRYFSRAEKDAEEWRKEIRDDFKELREGLTSVNERMLEQNGRLAENEKEIALLKLDADRDRHQESQDRIDEQRSKSESGARSTDKWLAFLNRLVGIVWFWVVVLSLIACAQWGGVFAEALRGWMKKQGYSS